MSDLLGSKMIDIFIIVVSLVPDPDFTNEIEEKPDYVL